MPPDLTVSKCHIHSNRRVLKISRKKRSQLLHPAYDNSTQTLSGERRNGNGHVSAHEDAIIRLMEAEALYEQSALAYNQMVDEIMKLLQCIGDTEKRNVAVAVIINKQRYKTVAKQYHLGLSSVYRLFNETLLMLDKMLLQKVEKK